MPNKKVTELADKIDKLPAPGKVLTKMALARANGDDAALEAATEEGRQMLADAGMLGPSQDDMLTKVKQLDGHIFNCNGRLKTLKEELQDLLEDHTAYQELVKAREAMARAKDGLQRALMENSRYNELTESIATERTDIKETKYTLSSYLVEYYAQTHANQVELDGEGQARDVVVTGKLGKPGKFQTNLFSNNNEPAAVTDGQAAMGMRSK